VQRSSDLVTTVAVCSSLRRGLKGRYETVAEGREIGCSLFLVEKRTERIRASEVNRRRRVSVAVCSSLRRGLKVALVGTGAGAAGCCSLFLVEKRTESPRPPGQAMRLPSVAVCSSLRRGLKVFTVDKNQRLVLVNDLKLQSVPR